MLCLHYISHLGVEFKGMRQTRGHCVDMDAIGVNSSGCEQGGGNRLQCLLPGGMSLGTRQFEMMMLLVHFLIMYLRPYKRQWFWNKHLESLSPLICVFTMELKRERKTPVRR